MARMSWMKLAGAAFLPLVGYLVKKNINDKKTLLSQDIGQFNIRLNRK